VAFYLSMGGELDERHGHITPTRTLVEGSFDPWK
jgi:hypothetical protein